MPIPELPDLGPLPQIISRIDRPYPPSAHELGELVTKELFAIWQGTMTPSEREEFLLKSEEAWSPSIFDKLDALILKQGETLGWRLGLSELVQIRFSEWDFHPDGPQLFEQWGKALRKCARIFQGQELPPTDDPDLYYSKGETVAELRMLLKSMREEFSTARTRTTEAEILNYFRETVCKEPDAFIHLKTNLDSWLQFLREDPLAIKALLVSKRVSPAALFDSWLAWGKGHQPETIRQKLSELGNSLRQSSTP